MIQEIVIDERVINPKYKGLLDIKNRFGDERRASIDMKCKYTCIKKSICRYRAKCIQFI